jgi:hypothetical protein
MVTESLTWERVFNGDLHPWGNAQAAQSAAASCGYAFMIFDGRLYTTDRHTGEWFIAHGATRATLAEGAEAVIALRETIQKRNAKIDEMSRGHQRLNGELDKALARAKTAEERAERQRRIIDSQREKLGTSTPADKRYAGA